MMLTAICFFICIDIRLPNFANEVLPTQALCQELAEDCGQGLVVAVGRHLERATTQRSAGDPAWWKTHEAVMLALGSVRDLILDQVAKGQLQFDLTNFIQSVVLADLDPNCKSSSLNFVNSFASNLQEDESDYVNQCKKDSYDCSCLCGDEHVHF